MKAPNAVKQIANHARRKRIYVLVADGGEAHVLCRKDAEGESGFTEVALLERPTAHLAARELVTDRTGRVFDSGSRVGRGPKTRSRHGAQSDYDPHAVEVERFAKQIAQRLDTERRDGGIDELTVIAEPRFLGVLRTQISAPTRKVIVREVARDLVHADERAISRAAFPQAARR
jgi:protein required for attachment to host cells